MARGKRQMSYWEQKSNSDSMLGTYFVSLFSLLLCAAMLLGTTFAWFHTGNTSTGNEINSGILKVDMLHVRNGDKISLSENASHSVFSSNTKWTPGQMQVETIEVCNMGNVPLTYKLDFVPGENRTINTDVAGLFVAYVKAGAATPRERALEDGTELGDGWSEPVSLAKLMLNTPNLLLYQDGKVLGAGESRQVSIALYMPNTDRANGLMGSSTPLYLKLEANQALQSDAGSTSEEGG